ncbi:hypothetical protein LJC48_02730 [Desulfovibrio sp. OttesenSCG-928-C06]|nr:hypothetical protein [Desulfovibrio sp. OttesenSCG-928-C06]
MGLAVLIIYAALILYAASKTIFSTGGSGRGRASGLGAHSSAGESCCGSGSGAVSAFFVNNRASGALGVALSIIVSCVGASATMGMIGLAFNVGTPAFWWLGAGCAGLTLLSVLLARKVRETGAYTMPQLVESFLGKQARPLISAVIVIAWMAILAAQFVAITKVLGALTGFGQYVCLAVGFGLIVTHTLGGQAAIMRVDRIQAFILLAALVALLIWLNGQNPGWAASVDFELVNSGFPAEKLVYFLFIVGGNYLVCPMLFGRFLSARNGGEARRGGFMAVCGLALCGALIVCVGLACRDFLPAGLAGDQVLTAALGKAPAWLNVFISIALISAIVSSADSCLVTASTVLSHDLLGRGSVASSRLCVIVLGLAGLGLSFWGKGILDYLLMAYDVYVCGVVVPVFIGLVLNRRYVIHPAFACAAVLIGGGLGAASALSGQNVFSYAGMIAAAVVALAGLRPRSDYGIADSRQAGALAR